MLHYCLDEWLIASFSILFCCYFVDCCRHYTQLYCLVPASEKQVILHRFTYVRMILFLFLLFCYIIFLRLKCISMCKNVPSKIEWIGRCENRERKTTRATEIDTLTILTYVQYISWMLLPLLLFGSPFVYLRRVRMCVRRNCEMYNVRPVRSCFRYIAFVYVAVVDAA